MPVGENSRPAMLELSKDKTKSDIIMRIVSPITPQFVSPDLRHTMRKSQEIRLQQSELIAAGKLNRHEKKRISAEAHRPASLSSTVRIVDAVGTSISAETDAKLYVLDTGIEAETTVNSLTSSNDTLSSIESGNGNDTESGEDENDIVNENENENDNEIELSKEDVELDNYTIESQECPIIEMDSKHPRSNYVPIPSFSDSDNISPTDNTGVSRIGQGFSPKILKRKNAPAPLRVPARSFTTNTLPMINSAPMRPLYGASIPSRMYPTRYLYPQMTNMPQSSIHYISTPIRRGIPVAAGVNMPRSPRSTSVWRRKPVVDVFEGSTVKVARMPSQPPSAQLKKFDSGYSDEEKATHEEMEEMDLKRRKVASAMRGCISFNDESAFNFTLFQGNESSAKKKFIEICETTWDKYMTSQAGS